jgi:hypothetical protein
MTSINITVPESLTKQKAELETVLTTLAAEEEKLASQRSDVQIALNTIANGIAILSGQPLPVIKAAVGTSARKPMSAEAKQRIADGLRKAHEAKLLATQLISQAAEMRDKAAAQRPAATVEPEREAGALNKEAGKLVKMAEKSGETASPAPALAPKADAPSKVAVVPEKAPSAAKR